MSVPASGCTNVLRKITIHFRRAPLALFGQQPAEYSRRNLLVISIQPHEAISIRFEARVPGPKTRLGSVHMDFSYADHFGQPSTTGYETLLYDCMIGDATLFHRPDIVEASGRSSIRFSRHGGGQGAITSPNTVPGVGGPPKLTRCSTAMDARGTSRAFNLRPATQRHSSPYFRIRL